MREFNVAIFAASCDSVEDNTKFAKKLELDYERITDDQGRRLVFFGILLMVTLRFSRNGLIVPIIDYFARGHGARETVAKRVSGGGEAGAGT